MRRVTAILLQEKNFGPNVIYCFFLEEMLINFPRTWEGYSNAEWKVIKIIDFNNLLPQTILITFIAG